MFCCISLMVRRLSDSTAESVSILSATACITASGTEQTYRSQVEAASPAHFGNAKNILDEDYYSPFDCTGYLSYLADPDEGWDNYKVYLEGVNLSPIQSNGTFMITSTEADEDGMTYEASLTGFNKFGIDYPDVDPTEVYSIEGMMSIYNGEMELFPTSITNDPGTKLWKVLYEGEDGNQYKLNDTLYVAAAVDSESAKLIFVTDNVDQIYYDTYADWGYAEWMAWYPDWIALDCTGNQDMFDAIAQMQVIKPATVKGLLQDRMTNPRLMLNSVPVAIDDAELPTLSLFKYDLSNDYVTAMGNEVGRADGYFFYKDGLPCLCSEQDTVVIKLNYDYAPALEAEMAQKPGFNYGLLGVFTLDEAWEENSAQGPMRRIHATDENYYTNYTFHPLAILSCASIDETLAGEQVVDVKYVSPTGVVSPVPQDGVNIVVTTRSDGSTTTFKRIVK